MSKKPTEKIKPDGLYVGGIDNAGEKILRMYSKNKEYATYRTKSAIRLEIDDDLKEREAYERKHFEISFELARIYSWLPNNLRWSEPINRQVARSIITNIRGDKDLAKSMLDHAEDRIKRLRIINGRLLYAISSLSVASALVGILMLYSFFMPNKELFKDYENLLRVATCGALGGALSVSLGFAKFDIDIDASWITNILIGASRIFIAITAAIFAYFAVESGLLLTALRSENTPYGVYVIAMIAGFSEMFVPNLMANLVTQDSNKPGTGPDGPPGKDV